MNSVTHTEGPTRPQGSKHNDKRKHLKKYLRDVDQTQLRIQAAEACGRAFASYGSALIDDPSGVVQSSRTKGTTGPVKGSVGVHAPFCDSLALGTYARTASNPPPRNTVGLLPGSISC
jgi:hypothetical protein